MSPDKTMSSQFSPARKKQGKHSTGITPCQGSLMGEEMGRAGGVSTDWNDREDEGEHRCRVEEKDKSSWRVYAGGDQDNRIDGRG